MSTSAYTTRVSIGASRTQLRDEAEAHIREMIVAGQARPGQLLRLAPLAERIEASITPVREALLLLAQDGWVVQEPNRGFRVAAIRRSDIEDAYYLHRFVAGELAARAAARSTPEALAEARALEQRIREAAPNGHDHHAEELNYAFHNSLYAIADSPRLVWFVKAASRFVPRRYWATIPGWDEINRQDHLGILDAVERHDSDAARTLMSDHIARARDLLLDYLGGIGFWEPDGVDGSSDGGRRPEATVAGDAEDAG